MLPTHTSVALTPMPLRHKLFNIFVKLVDEINGFRRKNENLNHLCNKVDRSLEDLVSNECSEDKGT